MSPLRPLYRTRPISGRWSDIVPRQPTRAEQPAAKKNLLKTTENRESIQIKGKKRHHSMKRVFVLAPRIPHVPPPMFLCRYLPEHPSNRLTTPSQRVSSHQIPRRRSERTAIESPSRCRYRIIESV